MRASRPVPPPGNTDRQRRSRLRQRVRRAWATLLSLALVTALLSTAPATASAPTAQAPVADAGTDLTTTIGQTVTLDGTGSSDSDGDDLSYSWTLAGPQPGDYTQSMDDTSSATPSFTPALVGNYTATLVVSDGTTDSVADSVAITVNDGINVDWTCDGFTVTAPVRITRITVAQGEEQSRHIPRASTWTLSDTPGITSIWVSVPGNDSGEGLGLGTRFDAPAESPCGPTNEPPVADAGPDQDATTGDTVTLDGTGSTDPDGDDLTYAWTLTSPDGSTATLNDASAAQPLVIPDLPGDYVATLVVNDGSDDSSPDTVTITVNEPANQAPVAQAQVVSVTDRVVQLDGSRSSDADGDDLTYAWALTGPDGSTAALDDATSAQPSFTADVTGNYTATLVVNDGTDDSSAASVRVTIANQVPVANAGTDQEGIVGDTITLDGTGSIDPDGDDLTYAWTLTSPDGSTAELTGSATVDPTFVPDVAGTYTAELIVNDGSDDSEPATVTITVSAPANEAPVAEAGQDQSALVGDVVTLDGTGSTDADGDPLSYAWSLTSPAGSTTLLEGSDTSQPTFTADVAGTYTAELVVNDGTDDSPADSVTITVNAPPNQAPVARLDLLTDGAIGEQVLLVGYYSSDPEGDELTYIWDIHTPDGSTVVPEHPIESTTRFRPDVVGTYTFTMTVNDGQATASQTLALVIGHRPKAETGPDRVGVTGDTVTLDGTGSTDADGDDLSHEWFMSPPAGSTAALDDLTSATPSFTADIAGTYQIVLRVHDGRYTSAWEPQSIVVTDPVNQAPVANAGPDSEAEVGATVTLDGTGSSDPDSDDLSYAWTLTSPDSSTTVLEGADTAHPTFAADIAGDYTAQLVVNDGTIDSTPSTVTITVTHRPVANAGEDQSVVAGTLVTLDGTGSSDSDGDDLTYAWSLTAPDGSGAVLSDPLVAQPTFTASALGDYTATLTVTDGQWTSTANMVTITARTNQAPAAHAGEDQETFTSQTVFLDGTGSSDPDGDSLTYAWEVVGPEGEDGRISDPTAAQPTFWAHWSGIYTVQVTVTDQWGASSSDSVTISVHPEMWVSDVTVGKDLQTGSVAYFDEQPLEPVDVTITVGDESVALVSPDHDTVGSKTITFEDIDHPHLPLMDAQIQGLAAGTTTLTVTATGYPEMTRTITVVPEVGFAFWTRDFSIEESAEPHDVSVYLHPLNADGSKLHRQARRAGAPPVTVQLANSNDAVGTLLDSQVVFPAGNARANTSFTPASPGTTEISLTQPEGFTQPTDGRSSITATVTGPNQAPVADAGPDQDATSGDTVTLDGTGSTDPDGDELTYAWVLTPPDGSASVLDDPTAAQPQFTADAAGAYTAQLTVSDPAGLKSTVDTVTITVESAVTLADVEVGLDLQTSTGWILAEDPAVPVDVTVTVSDASVALVSADSSTVGSSTITLEDVSQRDGLANVQVQGLAVGTTTVTVTAPGYAEATATIVVTADRAVSFPMDGFNHPVGGGPFDIYVDLFRLDASGYRSETQQLRPGADPIIVPLTNTDDTVGTLSTLTAEIQGGNSRGAVEFTPLSAGTTLINLTQPLGFTDAPDGSTGITGIVRPPAEIFVDDVTVGQDLQTLVTAELSHPPISPMDVTMTVDAPSTALLAINGGDQGSASITFEEVSDTTTLQFWVQGLAQGSTTLTVSAPGWPDDTATITVVGSGFYLPSLSGRTTAANSVDSTIYIFSVALRPDGSMGARQSLRGGTSLPLALTNSNDTVGTLDPGDPTHWGSSMRTIVRFDPHAVGTSTVTLIQPPGFTQPTDGPGTATFTVVESQVLLGGVTVDAGQVTTTTIRLAEPPENPTDMGLRVDNPIPDPEPGVPPGPDPVALISTSPDGPWSDSIRFEGVTDTSEHTVYVKGVRAGTVDFTGGSPDLFGALSSITVPGDPALAGLMVGNLHLDPIVFTLSRSDLPAGVRSTSSDV